MIKCNNSAILKWENVQDSESSIKILHHSKFFVEFRNFCKVKQ